MPTKTAPAAAPTGCHRTERQSHIAAQLPYYVRFPTLALALLLALQIPTGVSNEAVALPTPRSDWWQGWQGDVDGNGLDDRLDAALARGTPETVALFLIYDHPPSDAQIAAVEALVSIDYHAHYIELLAISHAPLSLVLALKALPGVVQVQQQNTMVPFLDVSARTVKARPSNEYREQDAWSLGYDGSGINIAILDTGVDDDHDALQGKFVAGYDATALLGDPNNGNGQTNPDDTQGHGTHVAATAMGDPADEELMGIAPGVGLIDVKVMTDAGVSNAGYTIEGIEWCIDHHDEFDIRILSMSFGSASGNDDGKSAEAETVNRAVEAGLVAIVAAGNDGENRIPSPASADLALTVGASDDGDSVARGDDEIAGYSNYGPRLDDGDDNWLEELKPELAAPGTGIEAASANVFGPGTTGSEEKDGTSMATPHVAGVAALLLNAAPDANPAEVEQAMLYAAERRGTPHDQNLSSDYDTHWGWGLVDAFHGVQAVLGDIVEVAIDTPFDGAEVAGRVIFSGSASGSGLQQIELEIAGDIHIAEDLTEWSLEWDTATLSNGNYRVTATAYAENNLTASAEISIRVNNSALAPAKANSFAELRERLEELPEQLREVSPTLVLGCVGVLLLLVVRSGWRRWRAQHK